MDNSPAEPPPEPMYLVDAKFYNKWIVGGSTSGTHPTKHLIASQCLTGPIVHSHLRLDTDCVAVPEDKWKQITQVFLNCQQIRRYPATENRIIEVNLVNVPALVISNQILDRFEKDMSVGEEMKNRVEFSQYSTVLELKEIVKKLLANKYGIKTFNVRIWKLQVKDSLEKILERIRYQLAYAFRIYHICIQGQLLDENQKCGELNLAPSDYLLFEITIEGIQCIYTQNHPIFSICPKCKTVSVLLFGCACKSNRYCSQTCILHAMACPKFPQRMNISNSKTQQTKRLSDQIRTLPGTTGRSFVGLKNLGNTCYINAALQCLANIPEIVQYYKYHTFSNSNTKNSVAISMKDMLDIMTNGKQKEVSPASLKKAVSKINPQFSGFSQQDSHQFLNYLIDALSEAKPQMPAMFKGQSQMKSPKQLFYGEFKSYLKCNSCSKVQTSGQPFLSINIQLQVIATFKLIVIDGCRENIIQTDIFVQDLKSFVYNELLNKIELNHPDGLIFWNSLGIVDLDHFQVSGASSLTIMLRPRMENEFYCNEYVRTRFTQCKSSYADENYRTEVLRTIMIGFHKEETLEKVQQRIKTWFNNAIKFSNKELISNSSDAEYIFYVSAEKCMFCPICNKNCYGCPVSDNTITMGQLIQSLKIKAGNPNIELIFQFYSRVKQPIKNQKKQTMIENKNPLSKILTLEKCLNEFSKAEKLSQIDGWKCPLCNKLVSAEKTLRIEKFPQYLIIHFKRFNRSCKEKVNTSVSFPLFDLQLANYLTQQANQSNKKPLYKLVSVCNHYGKLDFGHYTAYCRTPQGWINFNDCQYNSISVDIISPSETAYFMFYKLQR